MATVQRHYEALLSDVYVWMVGGFEQGLRTNSRFFEAHDVRPRGNGVAVDLGAGCGFQSIPLARAGFSVTAVDTDRGLLEELERRRGTLPIRTVRGDLLELERHVDGRAELIVCMTDTLTHLSSAGEVAALLDKVHAALEQGGRFIVTFRDLSTELGDLDRFIPVRSDEDRIFTCFLEYEPETVKVHDLLYRRTDTGWALSKSFYRKLRLSAETVTDGLRGAGFDILQSEVDNGLVRLIAAR